MRTSPDFGRKTRRGYAEALVDIDEASEIIAQDAPRRANDWYRGVKRAISGLSEMPHRFSTCPEAPEIGADIRQFHYHSHRVIFRVIEAERVVQVLRVYHGSRRALDSRSLPE